ncbi:MAG: MoaD/ThiS family protein [bacterium]|jgi:molybdopterin converting factor small subunit
MRVVFYPPYDTLIGRSELNIDVENITLWELLLNIGQNYPNFNKELPTESSDEALRARMLPIGNGHIYSVNDVLSPDATVKLFPPVFGG